MEKRKVNFIINKSGGTAGKGGYTYRVTVPTKIAKDMGVTSDDKAADMLYDPDTKTLIIQKSK